MNEELAEIKGTFKGLIWGALLTLVALLFLENEKGEKLKKKLEEKGEDWLGELSDLFERLEEKSEELVEEAREVEGELKEKTTTAGQEVTAKIGRKLDASVDHIEALQKHGREISGGIKKRLFKNIPKKPRAS